MVPENGNLLTNVLVVCFVLFKVAEIEAVDPASTYALVQATVPGPWYRHLYRIPLTSRSVTNPECLTCHGGQSCLFNSFKVSTTAFLVL